MMSAYQRAQRQFVHKPSCQIYFGIDIARQLLDIFWFLDSHLCRTHSVLSCLLHCAYQQAQLDCFTMFAMTKTQSWQEALRPNCLMLSLNEATTDVRCDVS